MALLHTGALWKRRGITISLIRVDSARWRQSAKVAPELVTSLCLSAAATTLPSLARPKGCTHAMCPEGGCPKARCPFGVHCAFRWVRLSFCACYNPVVARCRWSMALSLTGALPQRRGITISLIRVDSARWRQSARAAPVLVTSQWLSAASTTLPFEAEGLHTCHVSKWRPSKGQVHIGVHCALLWVRLEPVEWRAMEFAAE